MGVSAAGVFTNAETLCLQRLWTECDRPIVVRRMMLVRLLFLSAGIVVLQGMLNNNSALRDYLTTNGYGEPCEFVDQLESSVRQLFGEFVLIIVPMDMFLYRCCCLMRVNRR